MERDNQTDLKVFNSAKLYVEQILFELMKDYQNYIKQSDFGSSNLMEVNMIPDEIKDIQRYNGLKGMNDIIYNLITTIKSTILIHNNEAEIKKMNEIIESSEKLKNFFYTKREKFFEERIKDSRKIESLNRNLFEKIKKIIVTNYANTEILMTRNKLLFADSKDEYASDKEIQEEIMREYTEG